MEILKQEDFSTVKFRIAILTVLISFFSVILNTTVESYFDPFSDIPFSQRSAFVLLDPLTLGMTAVLTAIAVFIIFKRLDLVYKHLQTTNQERKARTAILNIPLMLIGLNIIFWEIGNLVYYIYAGFFDGKHTVEVLVSMLYLGVAGCLTGIALSIVVNYNTKELKKALGLTEIRENEADWFSKYKTSIVTGIYVVYLMVTFMHVLATYSGYEHRTGDLPPSMLPAWIMASVVFFIGIILMYFLTKENSFQTRSIENQIKSVLSGGEKSDELLTIINFDETGILIHWLNKMITQFRAMIESVKISGNGFADLVASLSASSSQIASVSNQQASAVKEVVSGMEETDQTVRESSEIMVKMYNFADTTNDAVVESMNVLENYVSQMNEIKTSNQQAIEAIFRLEDEISAVTDIIQSISKIADQTRIIAFNAELEASSAGEQGKSFEIVAYEIRRLADNTMNFTSTIVERLHEFQRLTSSISSVSRGNSNKINKGWEMTTRVQEAFTVIHENSNQSSECANEIMAGMDHMVNSLATMLATLKQISSSIDNFSESTMSLNKASDLAKIELKRLTELVK